MPQKHFSLKWVVNYSKNFSLTMKKINDIKTNLEEDIRLDKFYEKQKIELGTYLKEEKSLKDISETEKQKIDLGNRRHLWIIKNNTKIFDSLTKNKKLEDIDIHTTPKINKILKPKFNKKSPKKFIRKIFYKAKNIKNSPKKIWITITLLIILLFINKITIEKLVTSWYQKILSIKEKSSNIESVKKKLNNAKLNFVIADILFKPFLFIPSREIKSWYHAISWWKEITSAWDKLLQIYSEIEKLVEKKWIENISTTNLVLNSKKEFLKIKSYLENSLYHYKNIETTWEENLDKKLKTQITNLEKLVKISKTINYDFDSILRLLWHYKQKNYLIVFQNNDEIRATWWFMWSMAIVSINAWKITNFESKDIYAYEWNLKKSNHKRLKPPKAIEKLTNSFWLRDANYFVNIKDSSDTIKYFVEKAWYKIDAIVYINQNTVLDFLEIVWEIDSKQVWKKINKDNFSRTISTLVEAKTSKKWTLWSPKDVLFNFIEEFKQTLKQKALYTSYLNIILDNINRREIMIYSFDEDINKFLVKLWLNWTLEYYSTLDFSYPVFTSISWNKSDRYIKRKYEKNIKINSDCSIDTNLKIWLSHLFTKYEEEKIRDIMKKYNIKQSISNLIDIQWAWDNYSFVKLLLPAWAKIEKNSLIEVTKLEDKTLVEFYIKTRRLETSSFDVKYKLENKECKNYNFKLYKQPWLKPYDFKIIDNEKLTKNFWIKGDYYYRSN